MTPLRRWFGRWRFVPSQPCARWWRSIADEWCPDCHWSRDSHIPANRGVAR